MKYIPTFENFILEKDKDDPCWDGYKMVGMKKKGNREVPNCVPETDEDENIEEKKKGLWANIHAKRKRGEKPAKPGDPDYPDEEAWKAAQGKK